MRWAVVHIVASPVAANGIVYAGSSYDTRTMLAIQLDGAKGDITGTNRVVWSRNRGTPYVPSPLLYDGTIYNLQHYQGVLVRIDAKTGKDLGEPVRSTPSGTCMHCRSVPQGESTSPVGTA